MVKKVSLELSDKAFEQLMRFSKQLGLSANEFATLCFEYVDVRHKGLAAAAKKIKQGKKKSVVDKNNLNPLSAEQIELLLIKAAQKKKN